MRDLGVRGYSLTIPHKGRALKLVDSLSTEARAIGAINTVINDGLTLTGHNTDWLGVTSALREKVNDFVGKRALIIGAGGAARSCVYALKVLGLARVTVCNRDFGHAQELAQSFAVDCLRYDEVPQRLAQEDMVINATPVGSHLLPDANFPFDYNNIRPGQVVFDLVTKDTALLTAAAQQGATVIHGLRMLYHQAVAQFELFTEKPAPREVIEGALYQEACGAGLIKSL